MGLDSEGSAGDEVTRIPLSGPGNYKRDFATFGENDRFYSLVKMLTLVSFCVLGTHDR